VIKSSFDPRKSDIDCSDVGRRIAPLEVDTKTRLCKGGRYPSSVSRSEDMGVDDGRGNERVGGRPSFISFGTLNKVHL